MRSETEPRRDADSGVTVIEMLTVVVILGIVAPIVVYSVGGISDSALDNACAAENRTLTASVAYYLADESLDAVPPTGAADGDEYERTLVAAGRLSEISILHNVLADGSVVGVGDCP